MNQCPKCHSERVEITDSECICFACLFRQERWDFALSRDYGGYVNRDWQQVSSPPEHVIERVESADLRPIKMDLSDLNNRLLGIQKAVGNIGKKSKGDNL